MPNRRIPLFPLDLVLFPGKSLPLHIFEPRYKLMINTCLENEESFGVVLAREGGIARVGSTAGIVRVIKRYEDGKLDILTIGQAAYRIAEVHTVKPYLEATVEFLPDDLQAGPQAVTDQLWDVFTQCVLLLKNTPALQSNDDPSISLAFSLAGELPLATEVLHELLEIRAEADRRRTLLERLNQMLQQLIQLQRAESKAGGNGHGLH